MASVPALVDPLSAILATRGRHTLWRHQPLSSCNFSLAAASQPASAKVPTCFLVSPALLTEPSHPPFHLQLRNIVLLVCILGPLHLIPTSYCPNTNTCTVTLRLECAITPHHAYQQRQQGLCPANEAPLHRSPMFRILPTGRAAFSTGFTPHGNQGAAENQSKKDGHHPIDSH